MKCLFKFAAAAVLALLSPLALAQPTPKPGTDMVPNEYGGSFPREIVWQKDGQEMVLIPYGEFTQGVEVAGTDANDLPLRKVKLPSYYIDKFEVPNHAYAKAMRAATLALPRPGGNPKLSDPDRPVSGITYQAAAGYAAWAGKILPTEAMWEKAARGPAGTIYTTGNTPPPEGTIVCGLSAATGLPVAVMLSTGDKSGYGVFHMGGNVAELCSDWYQRRPYTELTLAENPTGPSTGESRVIRGGGYSSKPENCKATTRNAIPLSQVRDEVGFRTVWIPRPVEKRVARATPVATPPPITRNDILSKIREQLTPHIMSEAVRLPSSMMAGRALRTKGNDDVTFVNLTPYRMTLTFVGLEQELVYHYLEPLPPMTYRAVKLPKEVDLHILGRAAEAPNSEIMDLGYVRAESKAILVMNSEVLGNVVDAEGNEVKANANEFQQYYSGFAAQWNELEILNTLTTPMLFRIEDLTRGEEKKETVGNYTIDPNKILRISLAPTQYRFHADYPGALGDSGPALDLKLDDRVAKRLFRIEQNTQDSETVTVITEKRPKTKIAVLEAKRNVGSK